MSLKDAVNAKKKHSTESKQAALESVTREPIKRLNVNVPESRLKQFKAKAAIEGTDMSRLINQWITDYLERK